MKGEDIQGGKRYITLLKSYIIPTFSQKNTATL